MAFRLSDYVTGGFLVNKGKYSTCGRLALRGYPEVVHFELVGWPAEDLSGKRHSPLQRRSLIQPLHRIPRQHYDCKHAERRAERDLEAIQPSDHQRKDAV